MDQLDPAVVADEKQRTKRAWTPPTLETLEMARTAGGGADTDEGAFPPGFPLNS